MADALRNLKKLLWPYYTAMARLGLLPPARLLPNMVGLGYMGFHHRARSVAQHGEDLILERILWKTLKLDPRKAKTEIVYADVGAFDPVHLSNTYLLYRRGCKGVVLDPSEVTRKQFRQIRPRDIFFKAVAGSKSEAQVQLRIPKNNSWGDSSGQSTTLASVDGDYRVIQARQMTLTECLKESEVRDLQVLSVDVEGAELEVLRGLNFGLWRPLVILVELKVRSLDQVIRSDLGKFLDSMGYQLVASTHITHFYVDKGPLLEADGE